MTRLAILGGKPVRDTKINPWPKLPVCDSIHYEESACIHHKILMGTKSDMDMVAAAINKVFENSDDL